MLIRSFLATSALALAACAVLCGQTPGGEGFPSPQAAAQALVNAARNRDTERLLKILGPSAPGVVITNDPVADENTRKDFVEKASEKMRVVPELDQPSHKVL